MKLKKHATNHDKYITTHELSYRQKILLHDYQNQI